MNSTTTIIVMAKAPIPGFAKTRLIPSLGAEGAAAIAHRLLNHAVEQALAAKLGAVDLCCTPDHDHPALASFGLMPGIALSLQCDGDLGTRMANAISNAMSNAMPSASGTHHQSRALLIGTDAPALDADVLRLAARTLDDADVVFVPAHDGGYALVGLRQPAPSVGTAVFQALFQDIAWSTSTVMAQTRERLAAAGLRYTELPPVHDIDDAADLLHLPPGWLP